MTFALGYGLFATKDIQRGDFVLEYAANLLKSEDGDSRIDHTYIYIIFSLDPNDTGRFFA
jgi:hypothetical protein